jgi:hypothetical protein
MACNQLAGLVSSFSSGTAQANIPVGALCSVHPGGRGVKLLKGWCVDFNMLDCERPRIYGGNDNSLIEPHT